MLSNLKKFSLFCAVFILTIATNLMASAELTKDAAREMIASRTIRQPEHPDWSEVDFNNMKEEFSPSVLLYLQPIEQNTIFLALDNCSLDDTKLQQIANNLPSGAYDLDLHENNFSEDGVKEFFETCLRRAVQIGEVNFGSSLVVARDANQELTNLGLLMRQCGVRYTKLLRLPDAAALSLARALITDNAAFREDGGITFGEGVSDEYQDRIRALFRKNNCDEDKVSFE